MVAYGKRVVGWPLVISDSPIPIKHSEMRKTAMVFDADDHHARHTEDQYSPHIGLGHDFCAVLAIAAFMTPECLSH